MHEQVVQLTLDEITLIVEALDSHEYWQLSESHERNDRYSTVDDGATRRSMPFVRSSPSSSSRGRAANDIPL